MQDVGTERIQASGVRKEYEYDRRPNQIPGRWLSFNEVTLATVQRCLVSSEDDGTNAQFTIYSSF